MQVPSNDNTQISGVRNTIQRLSMQASRRSSLPDRAIAERDLGDVQPWGIAALVAIALGLIAYSVAQALNDVRRPFLKAEDNARLAKQYASESKKLAKQAQGYASKAKAEAKRHHAEAQKQQAEEHRARLLREVEAERIAEEQRQQSEQAQAGR
jgi:hypothetical protein